MFTIVSDPDLDLDPKPTDLEPAKSWIRIHNTEGQDPDPTKKVRIPPDQDLVHCFEAIKP
jgi:hypothetical protein